MAPGLSCLSSKAIWVPRFFGHFDTEVLGPKKFSPRSLLSPFLYFVHGLDVCARLRLLPQRPAELARVPSATPVPLHATQFWVSKCQCNLPLLLQSSGPRCTRNKMRLGFVDCPKFGRVSLPLNHYVARAMALVMQMSIGIVNFIPLKGIPLWGILNMSIQSFSCEITEEFFVNGNVPKKMKWTTVAQVARRKLDMLHFATEFRDLRSPPGNRLEALKVR